MSDYSLADYTLQIAPAGFMYFGPPVSQIEALRRLLLHKGTVSIDTETIALKGDKTVFDGDDKVSLSAKTCIGIGIAIAPWEAFYFPLGAGHDWKNVPAVDSSPVLEKIDDPDCLKVFFNCMFDLERIEDATGHMAEPFQDLSLATRVQGLWNSLDLLVGHLLGRDHPAISDFLPKGKTMLDVPYKSTAWKCIRDCMATLQLWQMCRVEEWASGEGLIWEDTFGRKYDVTPGQVDCYLKDMRMIPLLRKMSKRGIGLYQDRIEYWYERLTREMRLYEDVFAKEGFRPGSPVEVGRVITERGNWLPFTEKGKQLKVDEETLLDTKDPLAYMVLEWRKRQKLRSTYVLPMRGKDRFETHFRLDLATGRLASSDRNVQNVPGENYQGLKPVGDWNVRDILEAYRGEWHWIDFSQAEMRGFAYLSKDPVMLQEYKEGKNLHELMMQQLWPGTTKTGNPDKYTIAKSGNFQWIFDADARTFAKNTRRPLKLCIDLKNTFMLKYSRGRQWMEEQASSTEPWVENEYGRRMVIPYDVYVTEDHKRKCRINYPVQGFIADIVKRAMILVDDEGADVPIQAHDELVSDGEYDWPPELSQIHPELYIPFEIHSGKYWR